MKCWVEIDDRDENGFLAIALKDLLPLLGPYALNLKLYLLELEVVLTDSTKHHLGELQDRIEQSPKGMEWGWNELLELAKEIVDMQNLTIVGCKSGEVPFRKYTFQELCSTCSLVVEGFDSSSWKVCCDDPELIGRLKTAFSKVTVITL